MLCIGLRDSRIRTTITIQSLNILVDVLVPYKEILYVNKSNHMQYFIFQVFKILHAVTRCYLLIAPSHKIYSSIVVKFVM